VDTVREELKVGGDGREGRRSVELVQALYRSARAGAAVALGAAPGA